MTDLFIGNQLRHDDQVELATVRFRINSATALDSVATERSRAFEFVPHMN